MCTSRSLPESNLVINSIHYNTLYSIHTELKCTAQLKMHFQDKNAFERSTVQHANTIPLELQLCLSERKEEGRGQTGKCIQVPSSSSAKICTVQSCALCKDMHNAKLGPVQSYSLCKNLHCAKLGTLHSAQLCSVQSYSLCKAIHYAKLCIVQSTIHSALCGPLFGLKCTFT